MLEDLFKIVKTRSAQDIKEPGSKVNIPSNLLFKCPRCGKVMFEEDFEAAKRVCAGCGYHARLSASERLEITADKNSFEEYDADLTSVNPLGFAQYDAKLEELRKSTGLKDAVITGECAIRGNRCAVGVMDSRCMMASMGSVVGVWIARLGGRAADEKLRVVIFAASGGARMQEGILSLMQMAKTSAAAARHSAKGLLYITVLTDPTTGGVTASFASLGDIIIAEPKIVVGFAGRRVIEGTIRQRLPDDFQSAEFLLEHGFIDMVVGRDKMRRTLSHLIRLHAKEGAE